MVKALVTIFDDETGHIFEKDKLLQPFKQEKDYEFDIDKYTFKFYFMHMNDTKNKFAFNYMDKGDANNDDSN